MLDVCKSHVVWLVAYWYFFKQRILSTVVESLTNNPYDSKTEHYSSEFAFVSVVGRKDINNDEKHKSLSI